MSDRLFDDKAGGQGDASTTDRKAAPGKVTLTQRMAGSAPAPAPAAEGESAGGAPGAATAGPTADPFDFTFSAPGEAGAHAVQAAGDGPAGLDPERVHQAAAHGTSGSGGALPHLDQIQAAFGRHDVSGISAHTDSRAAEGARAMGAEAFADGERVAFGGTPSLHTAAHEAAHVVQQRGGVQLKGGVGEAGDQYEQHANAVADLVVQGKSAESVLDRYAGPGMARGGAIQRIDTSFGKFDAPTYKKVGPVGKEIGLDIKLTFDPDVKKVDAEKIGLVQTVNVTLGGGAAAMYPARKDRQVPAGQTGEGTEIDRLASGPYGNPLYAADSPTGKEKNLGETPTVPGWGQHGWAYKDAKGGQHHQIAKLNDTPTLGNMKNSGQVFEVAALAVEGKQAGTYMGSVSWGWSIDGAGTFTQKPLALVSKGDPSKGFVNAAKQWNSIANFGGVKALASPTNIYDGTLSVAFTVAKGTDITLKGQAYAVNDVFYNDVTIASGKEKGKTGYAKVRDMDDVGGPNPVLKLPIP